MLLFQACDRGPVVDPPVDAPLVAAVEDVYTVGARTGEDWERFGRIGAVAFNAAGGPAIPDAFGPDGLMAYVEAGALGVQRVRVTRLVGLGGH